ncbi:MAG: hypothetical protein E7656_06200 [Ruminococcaceae bacterium]|nr:hypothetical protein [Oscillospiraceae bacterium]
MKIFDIPKTRFISHRGFMPLAPENSLPSFAYAGILGQWAIETDVHITKDGGIICCHNESIDQYCNSTGKISDMTLKELRGLEIIHGNRVNCFTAEERRLPIFSEYLGICKKHGSIPFIELKTDDAEYVIYNLRKCGFDDDAVVMSSTELSRLGETRRVSKNMFIHWIFADKSRLSCLSALGNAGLSWCVSDPFECDKVSVDLAHGMDLKVCLRAADSVKNLEQMKKLGLDYFPTNCMHETISGDML